ncbi:hypothetical protein Fmac_005469 [Flemingia macrophylla]|uniref:Uncharacterized protein n=1 Tax=Flemingia macrophylla TaxID=520843 RepID=A0ABD1N7U7_9FABA
MKKSMGIREGFNLKQKYKENASTVAILLKRINSEMASKENTMKRYKGTPHSNFFQWNASASDWVGAKCDASCALVYSLLLPTVGLVGSLPPNTISLLAQLQIVSLYSNNLTRF